MHIEHLSHWSGHLNREMYVNRYGHAGIPIVVFPSSIKDAQASIIPKSQYSLWLPPEEAKNNNWDASMSVSIDIHFTVKMTTPVAKMFNMHILSPLY